MALGKPFLFNAQLESGGGEEPLLEFLILTIQHCWVPFWFPWQKAFHINLYTCAWLVASPLSSHQQTASPHCPGHDWYPLIHRTTAWRCGLSQAGLTCVLSNSLSAKSAQVQVTWGLWSSTMESCLLKSLISPSHAQSLGQWWFSRDSKDFTLGNVILVMGESVNSV